MSKETAAEKAKKAIDEALKAPSFVAPKQQPGTGGKVSPANAPYQVGTGKQTGRPTDKMMGMEYKRFHCRLSKPLLNRITLCLAEMKTKEEVKTKDGLVELALSEFLESRGF